MPASIINCLFIHEDKALPKQYAYPRKAINERNTAVVLEFKYLFCQHAQRLHAPQTLRA